MAENNLAHLTERLTVVLDEDLLEHVRLRAFEERMSRSAYVRGLVEQDADAAAPFDYAGSARHSGGEV